MWFLKKLLPVLGVGFVCLTVIAHLAGREEAWAGWVAIACVAFYVLFGFSVMQQPYRMRPKRRRRY